MVDTLELSTPDGSAEAFLARPTGTTKGGVILYMDAIGMRPRIADMAEHIASWGYTVLAPNLFHRWGSIDELAPKGSLLEPEAREAFFGSGVMERVHGYTPELSATDTEVWVEALTKEIGAEAPIGTTGYCMGGRHATLAAAQFSDRVAAASGWHTGGMVTADGSGPYLAIPQARAEFFYGWADNDGSMTPENVATVDAVLVESGLPFHSEVFVGAIHGYTMSDTSSYGPEHEARHWRELESLFARTLS